MRWRVVRPTLFGWGGVRASRAGEGAIAFANFHFLMTPPILFSQQSSSRRGAETSTICLQRNEDTVQDNCSGALRAPNLFSSGGSFGFAQDRLRPPLQAHAYFRVWGRGRMYDGFCKSRSGGFQPPTKNNGALESAAPWPPGNDGMLVAPTRMTPAVKARMICNIDKLFSMGPVLAGSVAAPLCRGDCRPQPRHGDRAPWLQHRSYVWAQKPRRCFPWAKRVDRDMLTK
jgi:hypothetical protein